MHIYVYVSANVYYAVKLMMVVSVLNKYRLFKCHYSLNNTVKQLFTYHIIVGIINNLGMI